LPLPNQHKHLLLQLLDEPTVQICRSHSHQPRLLRRSPSISAHRIRHHYSPHQYYRQRVSLQHRQRVQLDKRRHLRPCRYLGDKVSSRLQLQAIDLEAVQTLLYPPNIQSMPHRARVQIPSTHCSEQNHHPLLHPHGTAHGLRT